MSKHVVLGIALWSALVACRAAPDGQRAPLAPGGVPPSSEQESAPNDRFVLVTLKTNPATPALSADEVAAAERGHFANMQRLAEEGTLVVAGPLGEPRSDPAHRGIFVFDVPTVERALALSATDPAVQAGIFVVDAVPLRTDAELRTLAERDRALQAERTAGDPAAPPWLGRGYLIVTAPRAAEAERVIAPLADEGLVLMTSRLGAPREGELLFILDATDVGAARDMLASADESGGTATSWTLSPWYATPAVAELRWEP